MGIGHLARVGHLYPSGGISDFEIQRMAPEGVQFLTTRMPFRDTSKESDLAIIDGLERNAGFLADAMVKLIAFNCTAASMLIGDEVIQNRIEGATGIRATTTIAAVQAALRAFNAGKIALFTPYRPDVVDAEKAFFSRSGVEVIAEAHLPCLDPVSQGEISPEKWRDLVGSVDLADCDVVLLSCAGIHISPVIRDIEADVGIPVVTSNSALLWHVLNLLDLKSNETFGSLFSRVA